MNANGQLDTRTLTPIGGGMFLAANTALAWVAARDDVARRTGVTPIISSPDGAYRDLAGQRRQKAIAIAQGRPGDAATPGYSTHGWGDTVDINNIGRYKQAVIDQIMAAHGFTRTIPRESWHYRHNGAAPAGGGSTPIILKRKKQTMYIVHQVIDGVGSYLVTDNGVEGLTAAQEEVLFRVLGRPEPAYVPLAGSEITALDSLLRTSVRRNAGVASIDPAAIAAALAPLLKTSGTTGITVADIEAALADNFAGVKAAIPTEFTITAKE